MPNRWTSSITSLPYKVDLDELLKGFSSLRKFTLTTCNDIHADNLPASLRRLTIRHEQFGDNEECTCTINAVRNLEHFHLDFFLPPTRRLLDHLLPTNSSTTLRSLRLGVCSYFGFIDYSTLDLFCNLKELDVEITDLGLMEYLPESALRLEVFKIQFYTFSTMDGFARAINSPSLSGLKQIAVTMEPDDSNYDGFEGLAAPWENAIAAITKLPNLEAIFFDAPQKTDWSTYFKQCTCLRALCWSYTVVEDLPENVAPAFESALEHIHPKPLVTFSFDR
jgi:hypothetical protein